MKALLSLIFILAGTYANAAKFKLSSHELKANGVLPEASAFNGFGCTGGNKSPDLTWKNAPAGTKSFAVTVYDPNAPTGSGWWHWTVFNIPANITEIKAGAGNDDKLLPTGASQGRTDFGQAGYGGACPPKGDKPHHYIFTVYALKADKLDLNAESSGALVGYNLHQNSLGKASFTVTYGRK